MRVRRLLLVGLLAAVLGGVVWMVPPPRHPGRQRLPDGTIISLGSISYGKQHRFVTGNLAQRTLGRFLPDQLAKAIGAQVHTFTNSTDELFVFVESSHQAKTRRPAGATKSAHAWGGHTAGLSAGQYIPTPIIVSDESGNESIQDGVSYNAQSASNLVEGFVIPLGADLSGDLLVRVCPFDYVDKTNYSAEFRARNPVPPPVTHANPPPLPQTNKAGEVKVVLLDVKPCEAPDEVRGSWPKVWTRLRLQILQNGVPPKTWRVTGVPGIADEAGNGYLPYWIIYPPGSNFISDAEFAGSLSPAEVWKFRFAIGPTQRSAPKPEELWVVDKLDLPDAPQTYADGISNVVQGFNVRLDQFNHQGLRLTISPPPTDFDADLELRAGDRTGKKIQSFSGPGSRRFKIPTTVKSVGVEFSITKEQRVEFVVKPGAK